MQRRRINISVDERQYEKLTRLKDAYGFKNVCELTRALLNILTDYVDAAGERRRRRPPSVGSEILDMFNELGDWEKTPANIQPPARHRTKKE